MAFTDQQIADMEKQRTERAKMSPNAIQAHPPRGCTDRYCWLHKDLWEHYETKINPQSTTTTTGTQGQ